MAQPLPITLPLSPSLGLLLLQALWLALPVVVAGVVHMLAVKRDWLPALRIPLDGGRSWRGARLFGDNKTWRGVVIMVAGCSLLGALQGLAGSWAWGAGLLPGDHSAWGLGTGLLAQVTGHALVFALIGVGYVVGELPNSFLKRRLAIRPGSTEKGLAGRFFFLLDQADSVLAALLLAKLCFGWSWPFCLAGIVALTALHLTFNAVTFLIKLRRNL
jgi:hypothetical protein